MDSTHLSCSQAVFGGCSGPDCERDCFSRSNRNAILNAKVDKTSRSMASDIPLAALIALVALIVLTFVVAVAAQGYDNWQATVVAVTEA